MPDEHNMLRYLQYLPTGGVKDIWIKRNGEVDVCVWLRIPGEKNLFSYQYEPINRLHVCGTRLPHSARVGIDVSY